MLPVYDTANNHDGEGGHVRGGGDNDVSTQDQGGSEDAARPCPKHVNEDPSKERDHRVNQRDCRLQQPILRVGDVQLLEYCFVLCFFHHLLAF